MSVCLGAVECWVQKCSAECWVKKCPIPAVEPDAEPVAADERISAPAMEEEVRPGIYPMPSDFEPTARNEDEVEVEVPN